jgi:hypothetical protein
MSLGVQPHLESGGGEKRRTIGAVALEYFAIRDIGREYGQVIAGRADNVDLRLERFVEGGVHMYFSQSDRPGGAGQGHGKQQ